MSINREENIKDFIEKLSPDKLNKILFTFKNLLQGKSVEPLIELMKLCDVAKLYNIESKWSLSRRWQFSKQNNQVKYKRTCVRLNSFKDIEFIYHTYIRILHVLLNNSSIEDRTMSIKSVDGFIYEIGSSSKIRLKIINWYRTE